MKQLISILVLALLIGLLSAVDFDITGELRTRAAFNNNASEKDGGSIDNRFRLAMDSELSDVLSIRAMFEVGNITWGDGASGGGLDTGGINVETDELYVDYLINAIDTRIRVGQQYWADHRGLVLDDFYSGVMLTKENLAGFRAQLGMIKVAENAPFAKDDVNYFVADLQGESPVPFGVTAMAGYHADSNNGNVTLMPYLTLTAGPATIDITPFLDYQMKPGDNDKMGMGAAFKADAEVGTMQLGADVLVAAENGLTTLSPWYQNGLYLYGIGNNHDGLNLYWNSPYDSNADAFVSAVATLHAPIKENLTAFGAAGVLTDMGWEVNAGLEYQVIEDMMHLSAFGAYGAGSTGTKPSNYAIGTALVVNF